MYRIFAIILNLIAAIGVNSVFQDGVSLDMQVPTEVVAGTEFEVRVNIKKGDLESFSRLQQDLPAGLTAVAYISSNADFSFEEKRVRLIWLKLPKPQDFSVVYKIKIDERLKGSFNIDGKFSYIEENERKSVALVSQPINILPSKNIDPSLIVDIKDFEQSVIPYLPTSSTEPGMACIRQEPKMDYTTGGYIVNVLVSKASKQKFAKIEEAIPSGYKAVNVDPKEAIFTFKGNTAKFLWMNLPADPYFVVSYKLIPEGEQQEPFIQGKFSYLEGEKTISLDIRQTPRDLANISAEDISAVIADAQNMNLAQAQTQKQTKQEIKTEVSTKTENKNLASTDESITKSIKAEKKARKEIVKKNAKELKKNLPYLLEPEEGVYFRVQLAAGHGKVDVQKYFKKYRLDKEVRKEEHEGWQKYSIGSFNEYKEARDYRIHIWNTTVIDDAFVSAYNSGKRITVQEALMISNQDWYK